VPLPTVLEGRSLNELKTIKEDIEKEIQKAEQMRALVKTLGNTEGFPYAMFEIFGALQDGVTILAKDLRILWRNKVAIQQLGPFNPSNPPNEDPLNNYCYRIHGHDEPCTPCACINAMDTRKTQIRHNYQGLEEGKSYDLWAIPLYNGHRACILITRDVTHDGVSP